MREVSAAMRLKFGMTYAQRLVQLQDWHPWFAWHPVRVDRELIWLERIERKGEHFPDCIGWQWQWEYRDRTVDTAYVCSDFHPDSEVPQYCEGCKQLKSDHKEIDPC